MSYLMLIRNFISLCLKQKIWQNVEKFKRAECSKHSILHICLVFLSVLLKTIAPGGINKVCWVWIVDGSTLWPMCKILLLEHRQKNQNAWWIKKKQTFFIKPIFSYLTLITVSNLKCKSYHYTHRQKWTNLSWTQHQ